MNEGNGFHRWWTAQRGPGPVVATAIHDGHDLRPEIAAAIKGELGRQRHEIELIADMFNVLNRKNYNNPVTNMNSADFGRITGASGARTFQLSGRFTF